MKLPTDYSDDLLGYESGFDQADSETIPVRAAVYSLVFPPPGFFPFYGIGNGDYYGYYWPLGREGGPPMVAFSSHDAWSLIPEHSDIEALYRCQLAKSTGDGDDDEDDENRFRDLVHHATGRTPPTHNQRGVKHDDFEMLLSLDPKSPYYLCASADACVNGNKIEEAEQRYRQSLDQFPEYVAAHFGLACVLRRQRRAAETAIHLRHTLMEPIVFYGGSFWGDTALPGSFRDDWQRKSLMWLQGSRTIDESIADDPFVRSIGQLNFKSGLAENTDIDVLRTIIDAYCASGSFMDAARIWRLVGDRAQLETTSFRARHQLNPTTYGTRLAELFDLAGCPLRARLVRSMLANVAKPQGMYL